MEKYISRKVSCMAPTIEPPVIYGQYVTFLAREA
jgi:hypothetical protein